MSSKRRRRDFPTPVSHPDDADDEVAVLQRQTQAAEKALEEDMRQLHKDKEIEQMYKKRVEVEKKKKKLQADREAQKKRIRKLREEMDSI